MRISRLLTSLLALAIVGFVPIGLSSAANAVERPITVTGKEPGNNSRFYLVGDAGADYAGQKLTLQRSDRPGAAYKTVGTIKVKASGAFKVRIYSARGSRKTCFKLKAKAFGGFDATTVKGPCIIVT